MAILMGVCKFQWYLGIIECIPAKKTLSKINWTKLLSGYDAGMGMDMWEVIIFFHGLLSNCMFRDRV